MELVLCKNITVQKWNNLFNITANGIISKAWGGLGTRPRLPKIYVDPNISNRATGICTYLMKNSGK